MSITSTISSTMKSLSNSKALGVASKAIGVAAIGSVIYDAHVNGKERAAVTYEVKSADRFYNNYNQYMRIDKQSASLSKVKKWWLQFQMDNSWAHLADRVGGYTGGFLGTVANGVVGVALGVAALKFKNVGKIAAGLLAAGGIKSFVYDVMGVGKPKNTTEIL